MNRLRWFLGGALVGYLYGKYRMVVAPIDEYHTVRMGLRESMNELQRILQFD